MPVAISTNSDFDYWNINNLTRKQRQERNVGEYFNEQNITPRQQFGMDLTKEQIRKIYDHGKFAQSYIPDGRMRLLTYDSHCRKNGDSTSLNSQDKDFFIEQFIADTYAIYGENAREDEPAAKVSKKSKLFELRAKMDANEVSESVPFVAYG